MIYKTILLIGLLALSACVGNSRPTRYFLLSNVAENTSEAVKSGMKSSVVLIGPLELAKYLDRTNIVYRGSANELIVSDFDAWAEGLDKSIARAIAHNLSLYLPPNSATVTAWSNLTNADIEVPLAIDRFDCDVSAVCYLRIFWSIKRAQNEKTELALHEFSKNANSASIYDQTKALSELLAEASQVLAKEIGA